VSPDDDASFALLDDCQASEASPGSRLYTGWVRSHVCTDPANLDAVWAAVQTDQQAGLHALLLGDYEFGARLIVAAHHPLPAGAQPALRLLMFRHLQHLSAAQVGDWLAQRDDGQPAGALGLQPSVDDGQFHAAIAAIHEAIANGETYQVNYTYRLNGAAYGSPLALYRRLRQHQPVPYGALVRLPPAAPTPAACDWLLSCSPELFVRHDAGLLTARPMKGTARRIAGQPEADSETARELAHDVKNRAENLMIVDLLRNDLGRVAQVGSVMVPSLFKVEPYATLFQMTSTVQARLRPGTTLPALLRAVFPCGSITGAPKHHTMSLIARLESTPRGLYCGAIGWVDAPATPSAAAGAAPGCGDFCLSVAIRTLTLGAPHQGLRPLSLGVGAGIVQDSVAADEAAECRLKARFLTGLDPGFELFETLRAEPFYGVPLLQHHLARLARSAQALGFACNAATLDQASALVAQAVATLSALARLRLALGHGGRLLLRQAPLLALPSPPGQPVRLLIAPQRLPVHNPLAAHKTTARAHYDAAVQAAEAAGAFDSLFFNADGALIEGGRSNVLLRLGGRWFTPPVADGALPGVMRAQLLADPLVAATERRLDHTDLLRAEAIWVCNALRGVLPAVLATATEPVPA